MAIIYSEQFETKKATTNVAGTGANYRIDYIVRNPKGQPVNSITGTISQVTTEGTGEQAKEKLTRVGNASVDVDNNRNYVGIEKHKEITLDNQAKIVAQYYTDVKLILTV